MPRMERIYHYMPERQGDEAVAVGWLEFNDDGSMFVNLDVAPVKGRLFVRPSSGPMRAPARPGAAGSPSRQERIYQYMTERAGEDSLIAVGWLESADDGVIFVNLDAVSLKGRLFVRPAPAASRQARSSGPAAPAGPVMPPLPPPGAPPGPPPVPPVG